LKKIVLSSVCHESFVPGKVGVTELSRWHPMQLDLSISH